MKTSINYKVLTVALGILVAMVIAFTLWVWTPAATSAAGSQAAPGALLHTVKTMLKNVVAVPDLLEQRRP